ncbi:MAG: transposase [Bacteriovoracaceae bacterium]|nr:transposase [Bacteriovoracaceae bacterium]
MHNLNSLFKIDRVPSDTHLKRYFRNSRIQSVSTIISKTFSYIQRSKTLEQFEFMKINGQSHYLLATDGSGYFRSEKLVCDCCMIEEHFDENNKMTLKFGHNILAGSIVHPDLKQVIPMCPEPIMRLDGSSKNDSEQTAFRRFLADFKREHPKLKIIFLLDALYANGPIIKLLREYGYEFLIAVKETKSLLFMSVKEGETTGETQFHERVFESGEKVIKTTKMNYRFANNIRLHQDKESPFINFVQVKEVTEWIGKKGKAERLERNFTFITDIAVTKNNIVQLAEGGRTRWKIENETFNTLKNRGYNLEYNYGHGEKNLTHNFIMSMFLAFFVDQIQEISCYTFKKLVEKFKQKSSLWSSLTSAIEWVPLSSWDQFYYLLYYREMPPETG